MEENTGFNYGEFQGYNTTEEDNAITRFFNPSIAENQEFAKENYLMDKGNAYNEYMFNKANEWNSAGAQMERAKAAGINPMLAAAGIAGSGATATPIQSQGASVGMNGNTANPIDMANSTANTIDTLSGATDKIGKLIGFGKENKLNFKVAKETAKKLSEETHKTEWERKQLQSTFNDFLRLAEANANQAEQMVENLQEQLELYKAEKELKGKQKELTEEQIKTQEQVTKQEEFNKWEKQFKDTFRRKWGVILNESDASMWTQMLLNGDGEKLIDALNQALESIAKGIRNHIENDNNENNPIGEITEKTTENGKEIHDKIMETDRKIRKKIKYTNKHTYYCNKWDRMTNSEKNEWRKKGYDKWNYAKSMAEREVNSASADW